MTDKANGQLAGQNLIVVWTTTVLRKERTRRARDCTLTLTSGILCFTFLPLKTVSALANLRLS